MNTVPDVENPPADIPGKWFPKAFLLQNQKKIATKEEVIDGAFVIRELISHRDCDRLIQQMYESGKEAPVGVHGYTGANSEIGSVRATGWSVELAHELWKCFSIFFPGIRYMDEDTSTDWYALHERKEYRYWQAVAVSPLLRFMRYEAGGEHYGHYDMGYDYRDGRRTLVSFVIYLSSVREEDGGKTRFLNDGQIHLPVRGRIHDDWQRPAREQEILAAVRPEKGSVLFFDHRMCHDVERYIGSNPRIIIRGDIVYWAQEEKNGSMENIT